MIITVYSRTLLLLIVNPITSWAYHAHAAVETAIAGNQMHPCGLEDRANQWRKACPDQSSPYHSSMSREGEALLWSRTLNAKETILQDNASKQPVMSVKNDITLSLDLCCRC